MFNIHPMPTMGGPIRPQIQGPLPGAGAVGAPMGGGIANSIAAGGGFVGPQGPLANPGSAGRSFTPMGATMGNHFVNQA